MGNNFWEGSLGVVLTEFAGVDLGKSIGEATIESVEDVMDILFAQDGTQPYDKVPTGQAYLITVNYGQVDIELLKTLVRGVTQPGGAGSNSALLGRDIYRSGRDNFAKQLTLTRVDSDGNASTNLLYRLTMFKAMPIITGAISYGPDVQKGMEVQYYCFYDESNEAFGYSGYASSVGL
jgi:hypothetical protein